MRKETEHNEVENIERVASELVRAIAEGLASAAQESTQIRASSSCLRLEKSGLREALLVQPAVAIELQFHKGLRGGAIFLVERSELLRLTRLVAGFDEGDDFDPSVTEACLQYFTDAMERAGKHHAKEGLGGFATGSPRLINPDGAEDRLDPFMETYSDGRCGTFQLGLDSNPEFLVRAVFNLEAIRLPERQSGQEALAKNVHGREGAERNSVGSAGNSANSYAKWNMDLILDVELGIIVAFGETEMHLKDVLNLGVGSIIELDKGVNDPVTVIVNDKPIAKGEVVIVDGNYGVKVLEVESTAERIRSLG